MNCVLSASSTCSPARRIHSWRRREPSSDTHSVGILHEVAREENEPGQLHESFVISNVVNITTDCVTNGRALDPVSDHDEDRHVDVELRFTGKGRGAGNQRKGKNGIEIDRSRDEASTLPYLLELLSVKDSGFDKIPMSPEAKKDRIIEALKRILLKGSEMRPLVMAFEDLHWIDKSAEDAVRSHLESIPGSRVLLIFTYRPEFVHTWGAKSYHNQLTLHRLCNRESLEMVAHILGTKGIEKALEELILEKTEGVPFLIEQFIKSLKDLKIIEKKENTYRFKGYPPNDYSFNNPGCDHGKGRFPA